MPVFEGSAKDYAAENGIGQKGRGRPSADALAFIANARKEGWVFSKEMPVAKAPKDSTPKAPKPVVVKADVSNVDPKAARAWAVKNGEELGDRGRVPHSVLLAYKNAMDEAGTVVPDRKVVTAGNAKDVRPEAPRVIPTTAKFQRVSDGKVLKDFSDRTACQVSGFSISHCGCPGGRHTVTMGDSTSATISLVR